MYREVLEILDYFNENIESLEDYISSVADSVCKQLDLSDEFGVIASATLYNLVSQIESSVESEAEKQEVENLKQWSLDNLQEVAEISDINDEKLISEIVMNGKPIVIDKIKQREIVQEVERKTHNQSLLYNGAFMNLIVFFESMFSKIFKYIYSKHQERLFSDTKYSYKEIYSYNTLDEFKEYVIERKITDMMYKNYDSWIDFLVKEEKISLEEIEKYANQIHEIIARRNLIAHNDGKINSIYLNAVSEEYKEGKAKNDYLEITQDYLLKSIEVIQIVGCIIILNIWKKYDKNRDGWSYVSNFAFTMLEKEKWNIASVMYHTMIYREKDRLEKNMRASNLVYAKLNYWQAEKWAGRFENVKIDVEKEDFSASQDIIQLAKMALLDQEKEFFLELKNNPHLVEEYRDEMKSWPIFRGMRSTVDYRIFCANKIRNVNLHRSVQELGLSLRFRTKNK